MSASLLALSFGVAAAMALASCGEGSDADLLSGGTASEINANLDMVRDLADGGDCAGAQDAAQQVSDQIDDLGGVDKRLKQALREGAARLNEVVAGCVEATTESISPATIPEPTESTTESPEEDGKKGEGKAKGHSKGEDEGEDEGKEPATATPPAEAPTTPTTEPSEPPTPGGGTGAPGGIAPGSAVGEDGD